MGKQAPISIVMATYNGARYVGQQLQSLAEQETPPAELVVGDDGSTDETLDIVEAFRKSAPFDVRVLRNEANLGYAANFLNASSRAVGEYVAFCDQDDAWRANKIARVWETLAGDPGVSLLVHAAQTADGDLTPRPQVCPPIYKTRIAGPLTTDPWFVPHGFAIVARASLVRDFDWRDRPRSQATDVMGHDQWVYFLARGLGRVALLADRLALYRQHGHNLFGSGEKTARARVATALETGEEVYRWNAGLAREHAEVWGRLAGERPELADRAGAARRQYAEIARRLDLRADLYRAPAARPQRLRALARLVGQGHYGPRDLGKLGARSLAKDLRRAFL